MIPVVSAEEMIRIERGHDPEKLMELAGKKIAKIALQMGCKRVALLIGKGNKGGDAYVAGRELLRMGCTVRAVVVEGEKSALNQQFSAGFKPSKDLDFSQDDLIIDGLLGTGFHGPVEGEFRTFIEAANRSKKKILAIDLPSGLNGTTGQVEGVAIIATATVTLGFPKTGLFLGRAWNYVGRLFIEELGLKGEGTYWIPSELSLPKIVRTQHKYERGFVVGFGGSVALKGAVKLSGRAALHAGAGIVKLFSLADIGAVDDELIAQRFDPKTWSEALAKAQSVFIGPGLGREPEVKDWLETYVPKIEQPCVIDADALYFKQWAKTSILTPHRGEMSNLLEETVTESLTDAFAKKHQVIVILKGAPTFIFSPTEKPIIIPHGDPGMATAGAGDVLTGIVAAMLAQGLPPLDAAVLSATIHALAGEEAAKEKTSYGFTASDIIDSLPVVFKQLSSS